MSLNNDLPKNHVSQTSKKKCSDQIELRMELINSVINERINITDEIRNALDTDKALYVLSGKIDGIKTEATDEFKPITRNTISSHGKLLRFQSKRKKAKAKILSKGDAGNATGLVQNSTSSGAKKETVATLKVDKRQLEDEVDRLNSELASLRSAYRHLLKAVQKKLPTDGDIACIVEQHNQSSVIRNRVRLTVVK